jgi:hypothetical protein
MAILSQGLAKQAHCRQGQLCRRCRIQQPQQPPSRVDALTGQVGLRRQRLFDNLALLAPATKNTTWAALVRTG